MLAALWTGSVQAQTAQHYEIVGKAADMDGKWVYMADEQKHKVDSAQVADGAFAFRGPLHKVQQMILSIGRAQQAFLLDENPVQAELIRHKRVVMGKELVQTVLDIKGDHDQQLLQVMNRTLARELMFMMAISFSGKEGELTDAKRDSLGRMYTEARSYTQHVFDSIVAHFQDSYVSAIIINERLAKERPVAEIERLYGLLSSRVKESAPGKALRSTIASLKAVGVGSVAPDFSLTDEKGMPFTLSSLKGKRCVLIDFWASWCGPCVKELPNVKRVYAQYHDRGFEVVSVSIDDKRDLWLGAINKYKLPWIQLSSLKGWKCPVAQLYQVTAVPAMFLLDAEGRIVSDKARGEVLEQEVARLCGGDHKAAASGTAVNVGIAFAQGAWSEVCRQAQQAGKPIFLDVYTSWCGPCKMMASQTFTQSEVGDFFNKNFISYKVDAEKGEGMAIAKRLGVNSYPSCFFLTPDEKVVASFVGAKKVKELLREGQKAVKNYGLLPELTRMEAQYAGGNRNKDFMMRFCQMRLSFGIKGGKPVEELVGMLTDEELLLPDNAQWIQWLTAYNAPLMKRITQVLVEAWPNLGIKGLRKLNAAQMRWLSACLAEATAGNRRQEFDELMAIKRAMNALDPTNNDNAISASIGGGTAYMDTEQIMLNFYSKNHCDDEFEKLFLDYLQRKMNELPADSLIKVSDDMERSYRQALKSDTVSEEKKQQLRQGHDLMQVMSGAKHQLLSVLLYNAAAYYWKLKTQADYASPNEALKRQYATWLHFFYALQRNCTMGIPVAKKLRELGLEAEARALLEDLNAFLRLQEAPQEELQKVQRLL